MKKVLLYTKQNPWCDKVIDYCNKNFEVVAHNTMDFYFPEEVDYIISFLSPWIIPQNILNMAKYHAINFHPGSREYPGIGCYNFALFEGVNQYGCVCHEMLPKVDSGPIYEELLFPIYPHDTVQSLQDRTMLYMIVMFYEIMGKLLQVGTLEPKGVQWTRQPFTHADLTKLCEFSTDYDLRKWYNACYYPGGKDQPYIIIEGTKYYIIREDHYESGPYIPQCLNQTTTANF
jgi:hypothetical protein